MAEHGPSERARAVEAIGKAIHGYACGCERPWPTNANVEEMAGAALDAAVAVAASAIRHEWAHSEEHPTLCGDFKFAADFLEQHLAESSSPDREGEGQ